MNAFIKDNIDSSLHMLGYFLGKAKESKTAEVKAVFEEAAFDELRELVKQLKKIQ